MLTAITLNRHTIGWAVRRKSSVKTFRGISLELTKAICFSWNILDTVFFYFQVVSWTDHAGEGYDIRLRTEAPCRAKVSPWIWPPPHGTERKVGLYCPRLASFAKRLLCVFSVNRRLYGCEFRADIWTFRRWGKIQFHQSFVMKTSVMNRCLSLEIQSLTATLANKPSPTITFHSDVRAAVNFLPSSLRVH